MWPGHVASKGVRDTPAMLLQDRHSSGRQCRPQRRNVVDVSIASTTFSVR
jgi:hypothetical protein